MKIKISEVIDEFLYRYADEGGNFDDPFLKIVHDLLNVDVVKPVKELTDEEIDFIFFDLPSGHSIQEFARAILRKASE